MHALSDLRFLAHIFFFFFFKVHTLSAYTSFKTSKNQILLEYMIYKNIGVHFTRKICYLFLQFRISRLIQCVAVSF